MRVAWIAVTIILGTIGALALLRAGERLAVGGGSGPLWVPLILAPLCLFGAWRSLQRARGRQSR